MRNPNELYNFSAFGKAIKKSREDRGWTREKVAEMVDLAPRYIMSIENTGQHPSLQKFYELVMLFNISVDQFFYPEITKNKTTLRRQLDVILDDMGDKGLTVVTATAKAIQEAKEAGE